MSQVFMIIVATIIPPQAGSVNHSLKTSHRIERDFRQESSGFRTVPLCFGAMHIPWRYSLTMVSFTVLASGSKGNSAVVSSGHTRILVDCGLSCRELFRRMKLVDEKPETLDAIVITHEHSDHVGGLAVTARKLGIPVYFTEGTHRAWMRWLSPRKQMTYAQWLEQTRRQAAERQAEADATAEEGEADESDLVEAEVFGKAPEESASGAKAPDSSNDLKDGLKPVPFLSEQPSRKEDPTWLPSVEFFAAGEPFEIGDIGISPFTIPHDAADPVGFVFQSEGVRMGFATDLGYISPNVKAQLRNLDLLLLESNHDLEMLRDGPYPWTVKQRVLSRVGHLSNEAAAGFLEDGYDGQAAYVILAHLSESNNLPELARVAAERALVGRASLMANRLLLAAQHEPLSSLYF
jgi:phosphoribosyl 1,2-cyclic phosphodiesterase